jgi:hypothetical protein
MARKEKQKEFEKFLFISFISDEKQMIFSGI